MSPTFPDLTEILVLSVHDVSRSYSKARALGHRDRTQRNPGLLCVLLAQLAARDAEITCSPRVGLPSFMQSQCRQAPEITGRTHLS